VRHGHSTRPTSATSVPHSMSVSSSDLEPMPTRMVAVVITRPIMKRRRSAPRPLPLASPRSCKISSCAPRCSARSSLPSAILRLEADSCFSQASPQHRDQISGSLAAQHGHSETVLPLVQECGADARAAENDGATLVYMAARPEGGFFGRGGRIAGSSSGLNRSSRAVERQSEPPTEAAEDVVVRGCVCTSGYEGDNATMCKECPAAKYKASVANAACVPCPQQTSAPPGKASITDWIYNTGYSGPAGGLCTACEAGKYKDDPGTGDCEAFEAGKFKPGKGPGTWAACAANSHASPSSDSRRTAPVISSVTLAVQARERI
jgi:hypothetical protein